VTGDRHPKGDPRRLVDPQLLQDNVGVELHHYPGAYHGFDRVPEALLS
jgi:acetyl esterase/lipase